MASKGLALYTRLLRYARPYQSRLLFSILASLGVSASDVATAKLIQPLIDKVLTPSGYHLLPLVPFLVLGVASFKGVARYLQEFLLQTAGQMVILDIRNDLFSHSIKLPLGFFTRHSSGDLMSRVLNDIGQMQRAVVSVVVELLREGVPLIGLLGLAFYNDWRLTCLAVLVLPIAGFPAAVISKRIKRYAREGQGAMARLTMALEQSFSGIKIIKAFGSEQREQTKFADENSRYYKFLRKSIKYDVGTTPVVEVFTACGVAAVLWFGASRVMAGSLTQGELFSTLAAIIMMYTPAKRLSRINNAIQQSLASAERVFEILDEKLDMMSDVKGLELGRVRGEVSFNNVGFAYDDQSVLENFTLNIAPGKVVALVGPSGAGKTTVAGLLARFYDPQIGGISVDDHDLRELSIDCLRQNLAYVDQETFLFNDTICNNIRYGRPEATHDEVWQACRMAYAEDFVRELPEGLETDIGDRGVRLSGGQRQRLCIARALLKDSPILILDEATSALDTESESMVQQALENLMQNRTTLVIAHRLSTIMHADQILVLEQGKVIESGTHAELLENNGLYRRLYTMQFQGPDTE